MCAQELQARGEQLEQLSTTDLEALMQSMENQQVCTVQLLLDVLNDLGLRVLACLMVDRTNLVSLYL